MSGAVAGTVVDAGGPDGCTVGSAGIGAFAPDASVTGAFGAGVPAAEGGGVRWGDPPAAAALLAEAGLRTAEPAVASGFGVAAG